MATTTQEQITPFAREVSKLLLRDIQIGLASGKHLRKYREVIATLPDTMPPDEKVQAAIASMLVDQVSFAAQYINSRERCVIDKQVEQKLPEAEATTLGG